MILKYPGIIGKPIILVEVECLLFENIYLTPMLLDTGADETCFPASFAQFFGHDNHHPKVEKGVCSGVGGNSVTFIHSVRLSLLDPEKSTKLKLHIAWTAASKKASFVDKLNCGFGIVGMDVMSQWKHIRFQSEKRGRTTVEISF